MRRAVEQHLDEWTGVDGKGTLEPTPNQKLDYDRGVVIMQTASGLAVACYPDRPGEYWLTNGERATDAQAQSCGWNIHQGRRQRRESETVARAMELVNAVQEAERDAMREMETTEGSERARRRSTLRTSRLVPKSYRKKR